jgi:hypothetical protein
MLDQVSPDKQTGKLRPTLAGTGGVGTGKPLKRKPVVRKRCADGLRCVGWSLEGG